MSYFSRDDVASTFSAPAWAEGNHLRGAAETWILVEIVFVALRWWARRKQRTERGMDDYTIILGFFACIALNMLCITIVEVGRVGYHLDQIKQDHTGILESYNKLLFAIQELYIVSIALTRLSVLFLYLRFFRAKWMRQATYALIAVVIAASLGDTIAWALQCRPTTSIWTGYQKGWCFDRSEFYAFLSIPTIITDLIAIALAITMVWSLKLSVGQRIGLAMTFLTGLFGTIVSFIRMIFFLNIDSFSDPTYNSVVLLIWTLVEPGTYLVVACLPILRAIAGQCLKKISKRLTCASKEPTEDEGSRVAIASRGRNQVNYGQEEEAVSVVTYHIRSSPVIKGIRKPPADVEANWHRTSNGITVTSEMDVKYGNYHNMF